MAVIVKKKKNILVPAQKKNHIAIQQIVSSRFSAYKIIYDMKTNINNSCKRITSKDAPYPHITTPR
jgi:hypothetical protein